MATKRMKSEERRRQIVDVTLRVVAAHGVQGTSTKRIAAAAGVSEATLYKHFASRAEILEAALDAVYEHVYELIERAQGADMRARLQAIAEGHRRNLASPGGGFAVQLFEFVAAPPESGLREPLGHKQLVAVQMIAAIVEQGRADGSVAQHIDPTVAAWHLVSVFWLRDVAYLMGLAEPATAGSASLLDTVLDSVCGDVAAVR
jgi:AcrR family transcriptional regulator